MQDSCASLQLHEQEIIVPRDTLRRKRKESHDSFLRWLEAQLLEMGIFARAVWADFDSQEEVETAWRPFIGQKIIVHYRDN